MSNWHIPLTALTYGPEELATVQRVIENQWLSMGPEVEQFEQEFGELLAVEHVVAVSSATAGLHLALLSLGLGPGDEVIQPALNFVAAANMTVAVGATPVFAEIVALAEPTVDPADVERRITPNTKAVVAMHYGGNLCRMSELKQICQQHRLALIEDACHAVGAQYHQPQYPELHGTMAGGFGDVAAFSFFSNKNLATGEGGMVVTGREELSERMRLLRSHGMTTLTWDRHRGHASSYDVAVNGFNYRLDELHAALGRVQLTKLAANNRSRREWLAIYRQRLGGLAGWTLPFAQCDGDTSGHLMVAVAPTEETRERVVASLRERRIQTSLHYPCIADFRAFGRWRTDDLALSREFSRCAISLPIFPNMTASQVEEVCSIIRAAA